ncbi:MAG: J domain-containing protein [Actinobacteria bacterium]|nr:J domain-containing protein [Actinomycetota bacterium]MBU1943553.1 J domain-containing protein [Actinomycetota bacterium]MBU2687562.1 J domain-containing protein [Actinomycetota bacterium]
MQNDIDRDLYEILGVHRGASADEIKRAYRQRARECHPDVAHHDPAAEHKFKELTFAYEVLSDADRRRDYDAYGLEGLRRGAGVDFNGFSSISDLFDLFFGGGFAGPFSRGRGGRPGGPLPGRDMEAVVRITLEEVADGTDKEIDVIRMATCGECDGTGLMPGTHMSDCSRCGGSGELRTSRKSLLGTFVTSSPCPGCNGAGKVIDNPCGNCSGAGLARVSEKISVSVPPGVERGDRLVVRGKGEGGLRGGRTGDLYVAVDVEPHPRFKREGMNLRAALKVDMADAALGTSVDMPSLNGDFPLKVPAGTQPGAVLRAKGKGLPPRYGGRRGEMLVDVEVVVPTRLSGEEKKLLQALRDLGRKAH